MSVYILFSVIVMVRSCAYVDGVFKCACANARTPIADVGGYVFVSILPTSGCCRAGENVGAHWFINSQCILRMQKT
jgi:hypothetical protein